MPTWLPIKDGELFLGIRKYPFSIVGQGGLEPRELLFTMQGDRDTGFTKLGQARIRGGRSRNEEDHITTNIFSPWVD